MVKANVSSEGKADELLAELATAAYRVARQDGSKGAFIDVELDLWYALQTLLNRSAATISAAGRTANRFDDVAALRR